MNPYSAPPRPDPAVILMHDARAVHDIAVLSPPAYLSPGPPWIAATITPGPNSGKATTPGAFIRGDTGQMVIPPQSGTVLVKQGMWQAIAGGQKGAAYAWNESLANRGKPKPEIRYSPFVSGGTVLFRPAPEIKGLADFGPITLLFPDWAQQVQPAFAFFQGNPGLFAGADAAAQRQLLGLLSGDNRLLAIFALRALQGSPALTPGNERAYLSHASGHFAAIVVYLMLAAGDPLPAEVLQAVAQTREPGQLRSLALGGFAASVFGDAETLPRGRAVLEAVYRQAAAAGFRIDADPYLYTIYRTVGMAP